MNPVYRLAEVKALFNLKPQKLLNYNVALPWWLRSQFIDLTGHWASGAVPGSSIVGVHVGRGWAIIACHHDKMEQLWLVWPPTEDD